MQAVLLSQGEKMCLFNVVTVHWGKCLVREPKPKSAMANEQRKERDTLVFVISLVASLFSVSG